MLAWKVVYKKGYGKCIWIHFHEAWDEFRNNELCKIIYPVVISKKYYESLQEFQGF